MRRITHWSQFVPVLCLLFLGVGPVAVESAIAETGGETTSSAMVDLRQSGWGQGQLHDISSDWDLYWNALLTPTQLHQSSNSPIRFPVPATWDNPPDNYPVLPSYGYATYRVEILVPTSLKKLYLAVPDMPSAYKLWSNGTLVSHNGQIGTSRELESPAYLPKVAEVVPLNGRIELVLDISNYHYRAGGVWYALRLTDETGVFEMRELPIVTAVFFGALLLVIGLYNISLFAFRREETAAFYFGLLCIVVGLRRLLIDERVLYLFNWLDWSVLQTIEHVCFYLTLPLFASFFTALFPQDVSRRFPLMGWLVGLSLSLVAVLTPVRWFTELNITYQILIVVAVLYSCVCYRKIFQARRDNARVFGFSLAVLAFAVIHDVLKSNYIIDGPNIAHFGVLAFVVFQAFALQRRYLTNLATIEVISGELKHRNQELLKMDEFKDEFLATTSHELRTPLHGIAGLASLLLDGDDGALTKDQHHKLQLIASTTRRLGTLVNDILDFSSIKHGKLKLHQNGVDLRAIADTVVSTLSPLVESKDLVLSARVDADARYVFADEHRLQQILFNLLGNSVKYTDEGFIQMSAHASGDRVLIEVADSGSGIPEDKQALLFKPFEQIQSPGSYSTSGTGLGLSICKRLVEMHGGNLEVESEFGAGASIKFDMPLAEPDSVPQHSESLDSGQLEKELEAVNRDKEMFEAHVSTEVVADEPALIYVVDDEEVNRELVRSQLQQSGYEVEVFSSGISVLSRMAERMPDLLLLDYMMPNMSGLEVCRAIRCDYNSYELPVMILTARHQIGDIVDALRAGANDYLIKPYHDKELLARVQSQLSVRMLWRTSHENRKLREEIEQRKNLQKQLCESNNRLLQVLNSSEEVILLLTRDLNIVYSNQRAQNLLSHEGRRPVGKNLQDFFASDAVAPLQRMDNESLSIEGRCITNNMLVVMSAKGFEEYDQSYIALMIRPVAEDHRPRAPSPADVIVDLTRELSESRKRIDQIEGALKQITRVGGASDSVATQKIVPAPAVTGQNSSASGAEFESDNAVDNSKDKLVRLLRLSLNLWERSSGLGKAELAEQSRCWRVYVDGSTVKTRTLDRYLSVKTIPDKPRWRAVVRTANFVLANCELDSKDQAELRSLLQGLEEVYS